MRWDECMRVIEETGFSRFSWPGGGGINGFDCNPNITINDLWGVVSWIWTWPGDWILSQQEIQIFFDMEPGAVIGSWWSTALTWVILVALGSAQR